MSIPNRYHQIQTQLQESPEAWLVTGVAGFIGSNLLEELLMLGQRVVGVDNFSTGHRSNLVQVRKIVGESRWRLFKMHEADICNLDACRNAVIGIDHVLHQAALGSVPRSLEDPIKSNKVNVDGFLNVLTAAKDAGVKSFTYAASSSTYGDHPDLPKLEHRIGRPLSPYAVTKYVNELYADVYSRAYGFCCVGLRYFNVFGPRQDPQGSYAAVIPKWVGAMIRGEPIRINGDGETSRDFCYIANVVQANILAAMTANRSSSEVFNVAVGDRTTLTQLFMHLRDILLQHGIDYHQSPIYNDFRVGDVRHSQADITKACDQLGYDPRFKVYPGLQLAVPWYVANLPPSHSSP